MPVKVWRRSRAEVARLSKPAPRDSACRSVRPSSARTVSVAILPLGAVCDDAAVWQRGETVVHQEVWNGRLWAARPLTVVEDTAERTLLWIPHGTVRKVPITPPTRRDPADVHARTIASLEHRDWLLGEHVWDVSSLWIVRPDDWYTVLVSWRPDGSHLGWYVNLQEPMRRNPSGFEAMDLMLDIVVESDLSWRWKDAEEFDEIVRRGIFDPDLGEQVARLRCR